MARIRTTKWLAQRVRVQRYSERHWFRTLRSVVCWTAAGLALGLVVIAAVRPGGEDLYSPGPVAAAHRLFGTDCAKCHASQPAGLYRRHASDDRCLACHPQFSPPHSERQVWRSGEAPAPPCGHCHAEHERQAARLAAVPDARCTECHADLTAHARGGPAEVPARLQAVTSFPRGHAAFREPGTPDDTRLRLNHEMHLALPRLEAELRRDPPEPACPPDSRRFRALDCADCHRPEPDGAGMMPVRHEEHCASCHRLLFDCDEPGVPHGRAEGVGAFLRERYDLDARPFALLDPAGGGGPAGRPAPALREERLARMERVVFLRTCRQCHAVAEPAEPAGGSPGEAPARAAWTIEAPEIPDRWMPGAAFSHRAHSLLACGECHVVAGTGEPVARSRVSSDVLVPDRETCDRCHTPRRASAACVTCHVYHREKAPAEPGRLRIEDLAG